MPMTLVQNNYGKSRVRLVKVARSDALHQIQELTVKVVFEGDFTAAHTDGDNSQVRPTDTMKNTVYALAQQTQEIEEIETFALRLTEHFLSNNPPTTRAMVEIVEHSWVRILTDDHAHPHSFVKNGDEKRTTSVSRTRAEVSISSGINDLLVLKTAQSGFSGFPRDAYTTLPETNDRILATSIKADWRYSRPAADYGAIWRGVRQTILETFAGHESRSVQHTLYALGEAVLEKYADIAEIAFSLPNIHCLLVDLARFGLENNNRIFVPTDEPHGLIEARLSR